MEPDTFGARRRARSSDCCSSPRPSATPSRPKSPTTTPTCRTPRRRATPTSGTTAQDSEWWEHLNRRCPRQHEHHRDRRAHLLAQRQQGRRQLRRLLRRNVGRRGQPQDRVRNAKFQFVILTGTNYNGIKSFDSHLGTVLYSLLGLIDRVVFGLLNIEGKVPSRAGLREWPSKQRQASSTASRDFQSRRHRPRQAHGPDGRHRDADKDSAHLDRAHQDRRRRHHRLPGRMVAKRHRSMDGRNRGHRIDDHGLHPYETHVGTDVPLPGRVHRQGRRQRVDDQHRAERHPEKLQHHPVSQGPCTTRY